MPSTIQPEPLPGRFGSSSFELALPCGVAEQEVDGGADAGVGQVAQAPHGQSRYPPRRQARPARSGNAPRASAGAAPSSGRFRRRPRPAPRRRYRQGWLRAARRPCGRTARPASRAGGGRSRAGRATGRRRRQESRGHRRARQARRRAAAVPPRWPTAAISAISSAAASPSSGDRVRRGCNRSPVPADLDAGRCHSIRPWLAGRP